MADSGNPRSRASIPVRVRDLGLSVFGLPRPSWHDSAMDPMPGAEPFSHDGSGAGVVVCHGFTGSPAAVRPWAEHLAEAGYGVDLPLLPGHGTTWQHLNRTQWPDWYAAVERSFLSMAERYDTVVVAGLSMGGCLALRLAEQHGDDVAGLLLVNPAVALADPRMWFLPVLRHIVASVGDIGSDIAKPGTQEYAYDRTPLHALHSQTKMWRDVRNGLPRVTQPMRIFRSHVDHVVDGTSIKLINKKVSSTDIQNILLPRSYHVATLDYDAPEINSASVDFIEGLVQERLEAS